MKTWIDFDGALGYAIPVVDSSDACEGMLIEGPQGWGEFSPPPGCHDSRAARWLTAAIEAGTVGWPDPRRGRVLIAVTVPAVVADRARQIVIASGCSSAAVGVAGAAGTPAEDLDRLAAVREVLGPAGAIRCDAAGGWSVETALGMLPALDDAAGGLEFVVDPCRSVAENRELRSRSGFRVGIHRAICGAPDPRVLDLRGAADVAVLGAAALGGVRRALRIAELIGLPCVVAGHPRSSIATAADLALAGVLPDCGFAHEVGGVMMLAGDVVSTARSLIPADGWLPVAPMPAAPDPGQMTRFDMHEPGRLAWWRGRLAAAQRHI
ncbi:MAG: O-succinylbenzoate synthase [Mycobacterium sp.]|nr:O-succinylbenzoate synthase [Mycobacterium sp.]